MTHSMKVAGIAAMVALAASPALAQRRGNCGGNGPQIDPAQVVTVQGTVESLTAVQGEGMPTLAVRAGGEVKTFVVGPYRAIRNQAFVAEPGDEVTVTAYPCADCRHDLVVAKVENTTRGSVLTLRNADGTPAGRGRGHGGRGRGQGRGPGQGGCTGRGSAPPA